MTMPGESAADTSPRRAAPAVSVIILTKDEERDLPGCLASLPGFDDVHVVDSGSADGTCARAEKAGAKVRTHAFASFGAQRNWALDHCALAHEWVLFLDADERATPAFTAALGAAISAAPVAVAGFYCCWKLMLGNRWLRRADNFPKWQFRLLRRGRARFTDFGHGQKEGEVDGEIGYLEEPYLHHGFSRGWAHWEDKHRHYARQEARARAGKSVDVGALFARDASRRNPALKILLSRLPGWPFLRFFYTYGLKGGFLEGAEAYAYCRRMWWYEAEIQRAMKALAGAAERERR